ncbi:MAG: hypothetical protein PWR01_2653 [Clostridiales bacterium]|nr:hypothetical protein [Clostridiales bacterium]MDN5281580.1 hypothetical protein [Candidatus Ozemobacter sp.]
MSNSNTHNLPVKDNFLDHLFASTFHSVIVADIHGKIITLNQTAIDWLGYDLDSVVNQSLVDFIHQKKEIETLKRRIANGNADAKKLGDFASLTHRAADKKADQQFLHYRCRDGSWLPVNVSIFPVTDDDNQIIAFAEVATDLTALCETQSRLVTSEKTMATIIDSAVDGIIIINEEGIVLGFNNAAEKIFEMSSEEIIGQNVSVLMPEPHRSQHNAHIRRYLDTHEAHIVGIGRKVDALRGNGEIFPIDLAVGEVVLDEGHLFTGFVRDLTESIRLESERNSFFQMSLDLFCILDLDGMIKNANPRWFDILGYTPEEIHGMKLSDFLHPDDFADNDVLIKEIAENKEVLGRNFRFRGKDGEYRWILWNSSIDHRNRVVYAVARDVSEQIRILEELKRAKIEAERSSQARGMFIAKMSHELRTPLNSIIGFSGILQKNLSGGFSEKDLLYLDRIRRNGNTLLKLINGILDYSKTESGFQEIISEEVNLIDLLNEIVDLMQVTIEEKNTTVRLDLPNKVEVIKTDQVKLRQIVQNLVDNAVKFSESGTVDIGLKVEAESCKPVRLEIRDSGPGISEDNLEKIFEAFQQCDNTVTRKYGGAGLGLAIAQSFARLLGFEIELETGYGQGSCFSLVFTSRKGSDFD